MTPLRVIDSGLRDAAANMALSRVMMASGSGCILRFFRFPPCVLIGRHQKAEGLSPPSGVALVRRPTGGGAVYVDEHQLCWELAGSSAASFEETTALICRGVVEGLSRLGLESRFVPGGDIEAGGRKICGTAGWREGGRFLLQGTLLLAADISAMALALGLSHRELAARVAGLDLLLDPVPDFSQAVAALSAGMEICGFSPYPDLLSPSEEELAGRLMVTEDGIER